MAISTIAGAGDNIVSTSYLYGGVSDLPVREKCTLIDPNPQTYNQFKGRSILSWINAHIWPELTVFVVFLKKYDIGVKFVTSDEPSAFAAAIDEKTKAIFVETIGNPKYNVSPISEIAKVCVMYMCL